SRCAFGVCGCGVCCGWRFAASPPSAPQVSYRATARDTWRRKLVRLLECGRRQKAQHTTHIVGEIVMAIARMLDRILAAPMRAPLKQTQLANKARVIGQPREPTREHG